MSLIGHWEHLIWKQVTIKEDAKDLGLKPNGSLIQRLIKLRRYLMVSELPFFPLYQKWREKVK